MTEYICDQCGCVYGDPLYVNAGICYECHLANLLPPKYMKREHYSNGNATVLPKTGNALLDWRMPTVRNYLLFLKKPAQNPRKG